MKTVIERDFKFEFDEIFNSIHKNEVNLKNIFDIFTWLSESDLDDVFVADKSKDKLVIS